MSYALNFKFELFFVFPFGTILYRKVDYFSAHGIGGQNGQGGCGKYTLRYFGEEDFTAASVSGP